MILEALNTNGTLSWFDVHLSRTLARVGGEPRESVQLLVALLSAAVRNGHVCLDLHALPAQLVQAGLDPETVALAQAGRDQISGSRLAGSGGASTPLVLDAKGRLYLRRYWEYEQRVVDDLLARAANPVEIEPRAVAPIAAALFPDRSGQAGEPNWQLAAALVACRQRLCVITGGPGTGKTYSVARILALLAELALQQGKAPPRVLLAAPTGKAASRLAQAIGEASATLTGISQQARAQLPAVASTIHRLLRPVAGSPTRFRFGPDQPFPADVVVIDECSMVDLALFSHLLAAIPAQARLILLGDEHQLASVEAGAVLGDLCDRGAPHGYSERQVRWLAEASGWRLARLPIQQSATSPLADSIVRLTYSHRFKPDSGIGALARAINQGNAEEAWKLLCAAGAGEAIGLAPPARARQIRAELRNAVVRGFQPYLQADDPAVRLNAFASYRVLCPHRHGPAGVSFLNRQIEASLAAAQLLDPYGPWYDQRPVLVTENNYTFGLFNGDLGIVCRTAETSGPGSVTVAFLTPEGTVRYVSPWRLPAHETAFAMTVHKSQGSEFDEIDVVLPAEPTPLLTRELLYTAVTRAKKRVVVHTNQTVLATATERRIERSSGLRDGLWAAGTR
jgi:exodeoxyribonuclease V alpha subunit